MKDPRTRKTLNWVAVGTGHLAIGGRPGLKMLCDFRSLGCTHVLTLQSEKENAFLIRDAARPEGLVWLWLPMSNGRPLPNSRDRDVEDLYCEIAHILNGRGRIYIHCAAGIHRTGMITYGLLRFLGFEARMARETLIDLRSITAARVGEHRLAWAERFADHASALRTERQPPRDLSPAYVSRKPRTDSFTPSGTPT